MDKKIIFLIFFIVVIAVIIAIIFTINDKEKSTIQNSSNMNIKEDYNDGHLTNNTNNIDNTIEGKEDMKLYIRVNNRILIATLEHNTSVNALIERLKENDITIEMNDYGNFEKVGPLGFNLPRNDKQITTEPGDIILYQGNSLTIYYDTNSWNFTKIGKIENVNQEELKEILGEDNVTITLSLNK